MRFQPSSETSEKSNSAWGKISSAACASSTGSSRAIGYPVVGTMDAATQMSFTHPTQDPLEHFPDLSIFSSSSSLLGFGSSDSGCTQTTAFVVFMEFMVSQCIWIEKVVSWRSCYWLPWIIAQTAIFTPHIWGGSGLFSFVLCWFCFPCLGEFHLRLTAAPEKKSTGYKETLWSV